MDMYVKHNTIEKAIQSIKDSGGEYVIIGGNCLLIDSILTIFPVEEEWGLFSNYTFSFSYNDSVINDNFEISYTKEDSSCYSFLKKSGLIDENNLDLIYQKAVNSVTTAEAGLVTHGFNLKDQNEKIDSIVFNEALIYLSNGINKGDKEFAQEDFKSKYEAYKKTQDEITENTKNLLVQLYNMLVNIRCYGDVE